MVDSLVGCAPLFRAFAALPRHVRGRRRRGCEERTAGMTTPHHSGGMTCVSGSVTGVPGTRVCAPQPLFLRPDQPPTEARPRSDRGPTEPARTPTEPGHRGSFPRPDPRAHRHVAGSPAGHFAKARSAHQKRRVDLAVAIIKQLVMEPADPARRAWRAALCEHIFELGKAAEMDLELGVAPSLDGTQLAARKP